MFKKLRNKIVIINMVSTTLVLLVAFSVIYLTAAENAHRRPFPPNPQISQTQTEKPDQPQDDFHARLQEDRQSSLTTLLISLIITGACVEIAVFLFSLYLAEQSIKPVKETYNAQKEFVANASHEIKTPLAVIQANLEAADIHGNKWIDNVAEKTADLATLNQQLLTLARLDSTHEPTELKSTDLNTFVKKLKTPLEPQLHAKNITLNFIPHTAKTSIKLNQSAAKQIINILLDNAIKYCQQEITITVSEKAISIKNDGTTIPEEKQKQIFERFYQADKTKSGVGLGLAIAKQLADNNHWQLTVSSDRESTAFTLAF